MIGQGISTSDGQFQAYYTAAGLAVLHFPDRNGIPDTLGRRLSSEDPSVGQVKQWHGRTSAAVLSILKGKPPRQLPPFDLSSGTNFQRSVWQAMLAIPMGKTRSYGELARSLDNPGATRAVGSACGANPIPVLIPCHRVLASGQQIGGFSAGMKWKWLLLQREGVTLL